MNWKFKRSDYRRPPVQLEHMEVRLAFFEDRVEGTGRLSCRAREAVREVLLDCDGKKVPYALDREYAVRDLWARRDLGRAAKLAMTLPPHGCRVLKLA